MTKQAIWRLRRKFIVLAMTAMALVVLLLGVFINAINLAVTRSEVRATLQFISENEGDLSNVHGDRKDDPEFQYATRFFTVKFDANEEVAEVRLDHIASVDRETAVEFALNALRRPFLFGAYIKNDYYYQVTKYENGGTLVAFLDSTQQFNQYRRLLYGTLAVCVWGFVVVFLLILFYSKRVIRTEIEALERQNRFITNASHELKTPLSVIRANTEIGEMMHGSDEWTESTLKQVDRLDGLVRSLVLLSRGMEQNSEGIITSVDVTKAVKETVHSFDPVAQKEGKRISADIAEGIVMQTDEAAIRQLLGLLLDNAIKYCDDDGDIMVSLPANKKGKGLTLSVSNSYAEGANVDYTRFFDRFYRNDEAHSVEKGGYGIGLSIAQNIVQRFKGSINANWKDGLITFTCILN